MLRCVFDFIKRKWKDFRHLLQRAKRGYSDEDVCGIPIWFVTTMKAMLCDRLKQPDVPPVKMTAEAWRSVLQEMVRLLQIMDVLDGESVRAQIGADMEDCSHDTLIRMDRERENARKRFFELFHTHYWDLWC